MSVKDVADTINVHYSTVYRELKRNKGRHRYHYGIAQSQCDEQWSPEQIRGWMLRKAKACVSVEIIYSYIRFTPGEYIYFHPAAG